MALHGLLLAAVLWVAGPWPIKALVMLGIVGHGFGRRLPVPPATLVVAADGVCSLPGERGLTALPLDSATLLTSYWVRLSLRAPTGRLDLLLVADQLDRDDWARLSARLRRAAAEGPRSERPRRPDLR